MAYLKHLPNARYPSPLLDKKSSTDYVLIKNLFRKNKILDWLTKETTVFNVFLVADGARPDTVAEDIYGDPELDYIVIISCGITNIRDEWPLSNKEVYEYAEEKYGLAGLNAIHHYETLEIRDQDDRLEEWINEINQGAVKGRFTKYKKSYRNDTYGKSNFQICR